MVGIDKTIFRKYDIRGEYPKELNEEAAYNIALGYANKFPDVKTVVVGADIRKSSPSLKKSVIKGLIDGGKQVIDVGIVITPIVYFAVCHHKYDGGIVVTGSHLDGRYNGIKMVLADAHPTTPDDYEAIRDTIVDDKLSKSDTPGSLEHFDAEQEYKDYLMEKFKFKKPLKIIIDCGNGTSRLLPEEIFKQMGCDVKTIYAEADDTYPNHIADPYKEEFMEDLKKEVLKEKADLGIGYDGDGDRAGFIDSKGKFIGGDSLLMLFTRDAMKQKMGPIAVDSRASMALIEEVKSKGQEIYLTVGYHAAVLYKLIEKGAVFGGETTCHFYFPLECYLTDDAVFASLKLVQLVTDAGNLHDMIEELPKYSTGEEIFLPASDITKYDDVDRLVKVAHDKGYDVNTVDGARVNLPEGWFIVRPSNTSPFIKVKSEGRTDEDLKHVTIMLFEILDEAKIDVPDDIREKYCP